MNSTIGKQSAAFLRKHPGMVFHYQDISKETGLDPNGISTALSRIVHRHPGWGVRRIGGDRSGQYIFRQDYMMDDTQPAELPDVKPESAKLYEVLGFVDDSVMVVRDEEELLSLWRRVEAGK